MTMHLKEIKYVSLSDFHLNHAVIVERLKWINRRYTQTVGWIFILFKNRDSELCQQYVQRKQKIAVRVAKSYKNI